MDVIKKLNSIAHPPNRGATAPATGGTAFYRPQTPKPEIHGAVEGREVQHAFGRFFLTESLHPWSASHGRIPLSRLLESEPWSYGLAGRDSRLSLLDLKQTLFLDTETTGLAGGTGTVAFLVGLGRFTGEGFLIEQFFMRDYDEERAMLATVRDRMDDCRFLVSYNGKSYDMNLLTARMTLSRISSPAADLPHFDLLHSARRLWKRRLADCSLINVERDVLGHVRQDDVPGFVIPSLYFEYLRTRDGSALAPVFRHNRLDLLALAALTATVGRIYQDPTVHLEHSLDFLSLGRAMESLFRMREAACCFLRALDFPVEPDEKREILLRLGSAWKRLGEWNKAVRTWEHLIKAGLFHASPYEELAKYYEHRIRDLGKAVFWTERALERMDLLEGLNPGSIFEEDRRNLGHRLQRLRQKQNGAWVKKTATRS